MPHDRLIDRAKASAWARDLIDADPDSWCIFDSETTGLHDAEILQIGLLRPDGTTLMDTLVRPCYVRLEKVTGKTAIPAAATAIHGITDAMVELAPPLGFLLAAMAELMHGKKVVVYNVAYDFEVLLFCLAHRWDRARADEWMGKPRWECAMHPYSQFVGDWNSYYGNYKWQRLPGGDHSAIGDARATLAIIREMAGVSVPAAVNEQSGCSGSVPPAQPSFPTPRVNPSGDEE